MKTARASVAVVEPKRPVSSGGKAGRNPALDFTKGALVLFMVLYHWLNYFHPFTGDVFRYLRFLTPSFIFITGFLISNVYLSKYDVADARLPRRLLQRGLKILAVYIVLNLSIALLFPNNGRIAFDVLSVDGLVAAFLTGNVLTAELSKAAAFPVLVPISYLLLLGAVLVVISRRFRYVFPVTCVILFIAVALLRANAFENANLELLAIGALGVMCGYIPIERIDSIAKHRNMMGVVYLGYLAAITVWNVLYPLQVFGVCLTLALLYSIGFSGKESDVLDGCVILLGKYSLFGYIVQIAIVFVLAKVFAHSGRGVTLLSVSFLVAFALTIASVEVLDRVRRKTAVIDGLYRAVFA